tara:strand:- start:8115 stop:9713 length:1599 start_codon:yes stop_codon:yes gene_type:complete
MSEINNIPVIDLFAGPGGLSEGFSSVNTKEKRVFDIQLSVEMEINAIKTLRLRSFIRQFEKSNIPSDYYKILEETDLKKKEVQIENLYEKYKTEANRMSNEVWEIELGSNKEFDKELDRKIISIIGGKKHWVLIGGPPCQAYSLVGRSRVGGIDENDNRVYLYEEYLRIVAEHQPPIFVIENVKGLLSAKVKGEHVFDWIKRNLSNPSLIFPKSKSKKYKIYSLVTEPDEFSNGGFPIYKDNKGFVIKAEMYGIPQKRHRVILLGIRKDIDKIPEIICPSDEKIYLKNVIDDLPKIRSGLHRKFIKTEVIDGKKKRIYEKVEDGSNNWIELINSFKNEILSWNGFDKKVYHEDIKMPVNGKGSEFVKYKTPKKNNSHYAWYNDPMLHGACNHESRSHLIQDLKRYLFVSLFTDSYHKFPRLHEYEKHSDNLLPDHKSATTGKFQDRFRVQLPNEPATTVTSHIAKDGHYFIHYDYKQCRSLTVREAARIQTFPDNYLFCGPRTAQFHQVGNAVPPYLAKQIADIVYKLLKDL